MTKNTKLETVFPTHGIAGGWRDCWDDPDDHAELRARAEASERLQRRRVKILGVVWRPEIFEERCRHSLSVCPN